jgi:hypothetical protein
MAFRRKKLVLWASIAALIFVLFYQFFNEKSKAHALHGQVDSLSVAIDISSKHIEDLTKDSIALSNDIANSNAENERITKENVIIKNEYSKRDEQVRRIQAQLKSTENALVKERNKLAEYESQLAALQGELSDERNKRQLAEKQVIIISGKYDSVTQVAIKAERPKKNLDELRRQLSPRISVLVGGLFEPSCESIAKKAKKYLPNITEQEIAKIYGDEGKFLRKSASQNTCSPEMLFLLAKSLNINPFTFCPLQTKEAMRQIIQSKDFDNWCASLYDCEPEEIKNAKYVILTIHNNFQ